jgi:hypothetical protein
MDPQTDIPGFLVGAGGTASLGWLWLRTTLSDKKDLVRDLKESDAREREVTAKVIEALVLNKTFLESHQGELSGLGDTIKDEMQKITSSLQSLSNELLNRPDQDG